MQDVLVGTSYPNGFAKSRLFEVYLSYRDFGCTPEEFEFDLEFIKLEETKKIENCEWFRDADGRLVVSGIQLVGNRHRVEITPVGFRLIARKMRTFISYAREDSEAAGRLYEDLRDLGVDAWFDTEHLLPGERWRTRIDSEIRKSDYVIAMLSERAVGKRGFVQRELRVALETLAEVPESGIYLIPVRLDECEPDLPALRDLQWVDLFPDWDVGFLKIRKVLLNE